MFCSYRNVDGGFAEGSGRQQACGESSHELIKTKVALQNIVNISSEKNLASDNGYQPTVFNRNLKESIEQKDITICF